MLKKALLTVGMCLLATGAMAGEWYNSEYHYKDNCIISFEEYSHPAPFFRIMVNSAVIYLDCGEGKYKVGNAHKGMGNSHIEGNINGKSYVILEKLPGTIDLYEYKGTGKTQEPYDALELILKAIEEVKKKKNY